MTAAHNPYEDLARERKATLLADVLQTVVAERHFAQPLDFQARLAHSWATAALKDQSCRDLWAERARAEEPSLRTPSAETWTRVVEITRERRERAERIATFQVVPS